MDSEHKNHFEGRGITLIAAASVPENTPIGLKENIEHSLEDFFEGIICLQRLNLWLVWEKKMMIKIYKPSPSYLSF